MAEITAPRSPPSTFERPNKRQRLTPDEFDGSSDEEESHEITSSMKAEMREELADLTIPKNADDLPVNPGDDGDAEVYGEEDDSDDDVQDPGEPKVGNDDTAARIFIDGEGNVEDSNLGNKEVTQDRRGVKRSRTAAEIMQTMVVRRGLFSGETAENGSNFESIRGESVENAHQKQGSTDNVSKVKDSGETDKAVKGGNAIAEKKSSSEKKKKRAYFDPRMWPEGRQELGFMKMAHQLAKKGFIKCCETGVSLDPLKEKAIGTLWKELRSQDKYRLREGGAARESREFLKACMRLGRMIEPERLAKLLGENGRDEDYCRFVLAAFLGLLNVSKVRKSLRNGEQMVVEDRHGDVTVTADGLYPSDDELIKSMDGQEKMNNERSAEPMVSTLGTAISSIEDEPSKIDENDEILDHQKFMFELLAMSKQDDEKFASSLSYVLRTYLSDMCDCPISRFEQFVDWGNKHDMAFEKAAREVCEESIGVLIRSKHTEVNRLKWLFDSMPAPEMGLGKSFRLGTADLWRHASENFSAQRLARMSLIEYDRLLDWLTYAALESNTFDSDQLYNREQNVIVSIAPIPLLYLADKAAEFAMKVLGVAAHVIRESPTEGNGADFPRSITADDIRYAAGWVLGIEEKSRVAYDVFSDLASDMTILSQGSWPCLLQRPLSTASRIVLCDRAPECGFSVPVNAVHEAKAVLDSFKQPVRRFLYAKSTFQARDPGHLMPKHEKDKLLAARDAWRKKKKLGKYSKSEALSRLRGKEKKEKRKEQKPQPQIEVIDLDADEEMTAPQGTKEDDQVRGMQSSEEVEPREDVVCPEIISVDDEEEVISRRGKEAATKFGDKEPTPRFVDLKDDQCQPAEAVSELLGMRVNIHDEFLCQNNAAELILESHGGRDEMMKRMKTLNMNPSKELSQKMKDAAEEGLTTLLDASKSVKVGLPTSISYHRMAWICMRALGERARNENVDENNMLGYGATANFTNFGIFSLRGPLRLTPNGLDGLIQVVDQHVRREAEILMACAAHDDGRPWIDRADVILVHGVRKEKYEYGSTV